MQIWWSFILILLYKIESNFAIECYICSSLNNEACLKPDKDAIPMKSCDLEQMKNTTEEATKIDRSFKELFEVDYAQEPLLPLNCLKHVTKVGDREVVLRGCQLGTANQLDICVKVSKLKKNLVSTMYCSLCNGSGCNAAPEKLRSAGGMVEILMGVVLLLGRFSVMAAK